MGQQQLLLIVLSVIIVGIAVAVGVNMFRSGAIDANRQALISDVVNYGAKAQRHYRTPTQLGGGSQNFDGFKMNGIDTANANGTYAANNNIPGNNSKVVGSVAALSGTVGTIYIIGSGNEIGDDGTNPVKVYAKVTADSIVSTIMN
ncbi:MAG TPA: hypothetical protein PKV71_09635 [Calditrichia bacterium]|nr:hypothetical protein [Calditrichota bacterium]HQU71623.1 hypothetical protein [Calditrichia bacterium]HQV32125.1 hypothetical protein [Calditrichia bacterium]